MATNVIPFKPVEVPKDLSHQKFFRVDFRGMDLRGVPMHHSEFICCDFTTKDGIKTDISGNDCRYSKFNGSNLTDTKCNGTDFAYSCLACRFYPSDAYGITLTMTCTTFRGMLISKLWWYCFMYFGLMVIPELDKGKSPKDAVIMAFGADRYSQLKKMFDNRQI